MLLTNVFLTLAILLNSVNIANFNNRTSKNQVSVEKNSMLTLDLSEKFFDYNKLVPEYFSSSDVIESRCKGFTAKAFESNFNDFYDNIKSKIEFLNMEIENMENNSSVFTSEYIFHRKNHILTEIQSIFDRIDCMTLKQKRKIICYEYINHGIDKHSGLLGFSLIYNDKETPFLLGTIVMPDYIGKLEAVVTYRSLERYTEENIVPGGKIYAEPLSYFDRYFLSTVGFR